MDEYSLKDVNNFKSEKEDINKAFKDNYVDDANLINKDTITYGELFLANKRCDNLAYISNNEEVIRKITNILPIYSLISTCLCAPIIEELLYRKTIGDIFNNKWLGIIIGGLLFGGAHVIGTYTNILDVLYVIPYGVLGSVFMYIYYDSDNIYNTMFLHFMHNSILMILYFVSMIN